MRGERLRRLLRPQPEPVGPPPSDPPHVCNPVDTDRIEALERRHRELADLLGTVIYSFLPRYSDQSKEVRYRAEVSVEDQKAWRTLLEKPEEDW